jgi:hypothetical protein
MLNYETGADYMQRTIKFINEDASSIHGSIKVGSIYTSESGEWKLGGFDVLSSLKDDESIIYVRSCPYMLYDTRANRYNRHTEAWSPTLEDILLLSWPRVDGTSSRRTRIRQSTHLTLEH